MTNSSGERSARRRAVDDRLAVGHEPGVGDRQPIEGAGLEAARRRAGPARPRRVASAPMATPASDGDRQRRAPAPPPSAGVARGRAPRAAADAEAEPDIASSANAMSLADWKRCAGLFSRQRRTTRSRCGGTAPAGSAGGSSLRIAVIRSTVESPAKARLAGEHLVEHGAEREDVGAMVGGLAAHLLRAPCSRRCPAPARGPSAAWSRRCVTVAFRSGVLDQPGQAEVEDLGAAVGGDEDVVGLQVAVDDALGVRGGQALRDLHGQVGRLARRERPVAQRRAPASRLRAAPARRRARRRPRRRRTPPSRSGWLSAAAALRFLLEAPQPIGVLGERRRQHLHRDVRCRRVSWAR